MMLKSLILLLLITFFLECDSQVVLQIGGLFSGSHEHTRLAFRSSVDRINQDPRILSRLPLVAYIANVSEYDTRREQKQVCFLLRGGVVAVLTPQAENPRKVAQSICNKFKIPHLDIYWNPKPTSSLFSLNFYPSVKDLSRALGDVVYHVLHWRSFTVLFEDTLSLTRLEGILAPQGNITPTITIRQLAPRGHDNRPLLKELYNALEAHIVLDCSNDRVLEVLREAREVKMMGDYQSFFLTSLDAATIDLSEFESESINVTAIRLIDPDSIVVQKVLDEWRLSERQRGRTLKLARADEIKVSMALAYDAIQLLGRALDQLQPYKDISANQLNCSEENWWQAGLVLRNTIQHMQIKDGLSGLVRFNAAGQRADFALQVVEFTRIRYEKIATWSSNSGINITRTVQEMIKQIEHNIQNKTFIVTSRIGKPYLSWNEPRLGRIGNDRFVGYSIDLIDEISKILHFKYEFRLVPDKAYGSYNSVTKKWNGLVQELLEKKADLAICDLTITYERETAVDFTMPFMTLGISILYRRPQVTKSSLFSFFDPFTVDVWLYMMTAYLGVSVVLYILARISPSEWANPHPCNQDPDELENNLSMLNSLWHNCGSIMQQGSDIAPQSISTRMVAGWWWFFTLIMISSYTANLAASITATRQDSSIDNVNDLAMQNEVKYGLLRNGATASFFKNSNFILYKKMWTSMTQMRPDVFTESNDEGVERVKRGRGTYAFLMESTSIEYQTARDCDLMKIGGQLDTKGYGIAMPVDSPYRTSISSAVLSLQESGTLDMLKTKWWKNEDTVCEEVHSEFENELTMDNVGGVFVVLLSVCSIGLVIAILEFLWNCRKIAVQKMIKPTEALKEEIKFALKLHITEKPVYRKSSCETNSLDSIDNK